MARLLAPNDGAKQVDIKTEKRTYAYRGESGGVYTVDNPNHAAQMKAEGFTEAALNPYDARDGQRGFTCTQCGFGSWFRKCSRCGNEAQDIAMDGSA